MVLACACGKRYRVADGAATARPCPHCGALLQPVAPAVAAPQDIHVLIEQKRALRDELRLRDRHLRIAQHEILRLRAENEKLRTDPARPHPSPVVRIAEPPVRIEKAAEWRPQALPSERLDVSLLPVLEDLPELDDAPQLPSDRVPLYPSDPA